MVNQFILVGVVKQPPCFQRGLSGPDVSFFTIEVTSKFKNEEGIYKSDLFEIYLFGKFAENFKDTLPKDSIVGINGHLSSTVDKLHDGTQIFHYVIHADKISFINEREEQK